MNREEFVNILSDWLDKNEIDSTEVHVSHGGSMLILGLRDTTEDIDLTVSQAVWNKLKDMGYKTKIMPPYKGEKEWELMPVNEYIDVHLIDSNFNGSLADYNGIYYRDAKTTLEDKLLLNRNKDQEDIKKLISIL